MQNSKIFHREFNYSRFVFYFLIFLLFIGKIGFARDFLDVPQLIIIDFYFSKAYLIHDKVNILVDAGPVGSAGQILAAANNHNIKPSDISLIIITHSHPDHDGGAAELKAATGAKILVHRLDAVAFTNNVNQKLLPRNWLDTIILFFMNKKAVQNPSPDIIMDGTELNLNEFGIRGKIIHSPGHTPGSISVVLDNGWAFIGDLAAGGREAHFVGDQVELNELKASIRTLLSQNAKSIYPGHGSRLSPESLQNLVE